MTMRKAIRAVVYVLLIALSVVWLMPLWFVLINAVKSTRGFFAGEIWDLPEQFRLWENISHAWVEANIGSGFLNSLLYGVVGAVFAIAVSALAAFALSALELKGRMFWFLLIYSGTIFPVQMYLIPVFKMYANVGLYDTRTGLILYYIAICIPFCLFVMRNYFMTFSKEVAEAARLDGCNDLGVFVRIYLPLAAAPVSVLFLFQFTYIWNELLFGMTLSRSVDVRPLMAGLANMRGLYASSNIPALLTAALIASIPTLALFSVLQKNIMQGLTIVEKK